MAFILILMFILSPLIGALLSSRFSVYSLVPAGIGLTILIIASGVVGGLGVLGTAFAVWCNLTCLELGYLLGLLIPDSIRKRPSRRSGSVISCGSGECGAAGQPETITSI
jgi:hypothetical protein